MSIKSLILAALIFIPVIAYAIPSEIVWGKQDGVWLTWIPAFTGFSTDPTINKASYKQVGKSVTARVSMNTGVSNATTFTITLPVAAHGSGLQFFALGQVTDNSVVQTTPGLLVTRANSTIADIYKNSANSGWTASGNKRAQFVITYEAQ